VTIPDTEKSPRRARHAVDGVLLLDKPEGLSSNAALQKVRWLLRAKKGGHTGTLDPLASGLLPLCFGEATKFSAGLLHADKTYHAVLGLGATTTTGDREGEIVSHCTVAVTQDNLRDVLTRFTGVIRQVPPMYSALKREGRPLYELARQGKTVDREAREVCIHRLVLLEERLADEMPTCTLAVQCSKGTYIRTLAEDIGAALGCGAYLQALRRTGIGALTLQDALPLETLVERCERTTQNHSGDGENQFLPVRLLPVDYLLRELPALYLDEVAGAKFSRGNSVDGQGMPGGIAGQRLPDDTGTSILPGAVACRVYQHSPNCHQQAAGYASVFLGLGEWVPECGRLLPRRLLCATHAV
jgi:tRNA pseudouridine55 synthase